MKVLIPLHGFVRWNGGLDFIRLLVAAIESVSDRGITLTFAIPIDSGANRLLHAGFRQFRKMLAGSLGKSPAGDRDALLQAALELIGNRPAVRCHDSPAGILEAAEISQADVIFPTTIPLGDRDPARIGYLYDFQHRRLPELFSPRIRRKRDKQFLRIAEDSTGIVVNSRTVTREVVEFLGFPASRILTLPFSPYALPDWFDACPEDVQHRHGIRGRYLLVCNHFWKHKDHATALRAFALLRADPANADLGLVMTGDPIDQRDPRHYHRLQDLTRNLGLVEYTRFLGLIPKRDQLALLRGCEALLQPTLFEGGPGGGSVYEAIGLGVPSIVSDIPINLEIDQGAVRFFKAGDENDLAQQVTSVLLQPRSRRHKDEVIALGNANLSRLGNTICDYLHGILDSRAGLRR